MEKKKKRPPVKPKAPRPEATEVVYTPPETIDRKKLTIRLLTVAAVVIALFVGFSLFFRVDTIVVSGNQKYNAWTIREVSGISEGDSLLTFGRSRACAKIAESLPYVKLVRIGIKLPGTVNIYIEEVEVVYSIQDKAGNWWLMTSEGRLVEKTSAAEAAKHTTIKGVLLEGPKSGSKAVAVEPEQTDPDTGSPIVTVTGKERLQTALEIVSRLEANGILGMTPSVDLSDMGNIQIWYGQQYQILLGDAGQIKDKVDMMKQTIEQMGSHQSGVLDISFSDGSDTVTYKPFE